MKMIAEINSPNGLICNASKKFPSVNAKTARVVPQPGQGIPVNNFSGQMVMLKSPSA